MGFDVKITTFSGFLDLVAPHSCRGCGRLGEVLCERCKNYNISRMIKICSRCRKSVVKCKCEVPVYTAFYREGLARKLVEEYKYQSVRDLGAVLAEMLDEVIPKEIGTQDDGIVNPVDSAGSPGGLERAREVVLVPLPTAPKHIRERGFDHTLRLAKVLARRRKGFSCQHVLSRYKNSVQVGADAKTRRKQAKEAYYVEGRIDSDKTYLLVDDVWTTGASMEAAISLMKKAGVKHLAAAVILTPRGED